MRPSRLAPTSHSQASRRQLVAGGVVLVAIALVFLLLRPDTGPGEEPPATADGTSTSQPSPSPSSSSTPSPSRTSRTLPEYTTTGWYSRMPGTSGIRGEEGRLITYRVEVEQGSGVRSRDFARTIDRTLRHPRGWTAGEEYRFQRVSEDQPSLTIRLATPETVDEECAEYGADTEGYTSCRAGDSVYLNLDRWYVGVPHVRDLTLYRQYLINHEVGHGLGRGHESCPGDGWRAPVMLQQTLDLDGCTANPWPRSEDGRMITGPPSP